MSRWRRASFDFLVLVCALALTGFTRITAVELTLLQPGVASFNEKTPAAGTSLGIETIQEFRVATNAYSADYGRVVGGVVNLVTKSSTNEFRGSAYEFFRDSALDARDFFDRAAPPPFQRHQFGGSLGGRILGGDPVALELDFTPVTAQRH